MSASSSDAKTESGKIELAEALRRKAAEIEAHSPGVARWAYTNDKALDAEYGPRITYDCAFYGHKWVHAGGANCGCYGGDGFCSVPVHQCDECGDHDYGDNEDADAVRDSCKKFWEGSEDWPNQVR